jgi:aspartate/methionine/tyrosine aminotransferase
MTMLDHSLLRPEVLNAPSSGIGELVNYAREKPGIIQMWIGEGDVSTPAFITDHTKKALTDGETFYTYQSGIPPLREAIAKYASALYGKELKAERFHVTGSGMLAIQLVFTLLAGHGDEVIIPSPCWPNASACIGVRGATPVFVPMPFSDAGFSFDMNRIEAAITPKTKAIFVNSPSNPMGTVLSHAELQQILDLSRKHNFYIVADEIYSRYYWKAGERRAPSFHDIKNDDDKIIFINSFSKNWAMTGWRMGWIECDPSLTKYIGNMIQYSTSGAPVFLQRGAIAALEQGESFIQFQIDKARASRELLLTAMKNTGRVKMASPDGAFYLFIKIDGVTDSRKLAFDIVDNANVGLAPGTAFGPGGEEFLRICYLRDVKTIAIAAERLEKTILAL